MLGFFIYKADDLNKKGTEYEKLWTSGMLLVAMMPLLQSCDDDGEGYSIGDFSWDWATVRTTGGGAYYLEGDRWGLIEPVASSVFLFKPVDGERVVALFNPLYDTKDGVQVKMEGVQQVLTKEVEEMKTAEEAEEFGNDPIVIYQGDMWLGGTYLNLIFRQNVPASKKTSHQSGAESHWKAGRGRLRHSAGGQRWLCASGTAL